MSEINWPAKKKLFHTAVELSPAERQAFLHDNCQDNEIIKEVEALIASYEKSEEFISEPAIIELGLVVPEQSKDGEKIGNFKIVREIGRGGMGAVYLAVRADDEFQQKAALKIIKRGMDTDFIVNRFRNERQILASLNHPCIARLFEGGTTEDHLPYFVMEYVDGQDLITYCREQELGLEERLNIFRQVCSAVSYAHQSLVVHRDLKPSNILVTTDGTPKLLDFGIAKILNRDNEIEAKTTGLFGLLTPEYASPEQFRSEKITTASDVYSLGVILYELLTGQSPYRTKSKSYEEIVEAVCKVEPARPSSVVNSVVRGQGSVVSKNKDQRPKTNPQSAITNPKSLRGDLDNIILKTLQKEPERRYQSVQEFSEDIRRHLKGLPVSAQADTFGYRTAKFVKRHRAGVLAGVLILFSLIGGIAVATWQSYVAKLERDRANARFEKLRETAKVLMNETRDTLDYLPGTIKLRQTLSEKSVDLLDSFYEDNSTDPDFLKELGDAYEKLGKTQLWEFRQLNPAQKHIERAIEIRRRIVALDPAGQRRTELANSLSSLTEVLYFQRNEAELSNVRNQTETLLREIAADAPTDENLSNLAQHLTGFVGTYKEFHLIGENGRRLDEANSIFQKISQNRSSAALSPPEKTAIAWELICQGGILRYFKNDEDALEKFNQAAKLAEEAYTIDKTLQTAFNYNGFAHRMMGEIYERRGDYRKALEMYRYSLDWLKIRENNESQSKPNLAWAASNAANRSALMLQRLGREKEAAEIIIKPWREYSNFLEAETNAASVVYEIEPLQILAKYFMAAGRSEEAVAIWRRHSDRVQKFLDKNPDDVDFIMQRIRAETAIGDIYAAYDESSDTFKTNDKTRLSKAKTSYQTTAEFYLKSQRILHLAPVDERNFQQIKWKIERLGE